MQKNWLNYQQFIYTEKSFDAFLKLRSIVILGKTVLRNDQNTWINNQMKEHVLVTPISTRVQVEIT